MQVSWQEFKSAVDERNLDIQYVSVGENYLIQLFDGNFDIECLLSRDPSNPETIDFETNYKPAGNNPPENRIIIETSSLPAGAATSTLQTTGNTSLSSIDSKLTNPLPISGAIAQSGIWTVQPGNTSNTTPWLIDLRRSQTILFAAIDVSSSGDNTIVSADPTKKIKVLSYAFVVDAEVTTRWKSASTSISGAMSFLSNGGMSSSTGTPAGGWLMETAVNQALILNLGGTVGARGHISYFLEA